MKAITIHHLKIQFDADDHENNTAAAAQMVGTINTLLHNAGDQMRNAQVIIDATNFEPTAEPII